MRLVCGIAFFPNREWAELLTNIDTQWYEWYVYRTRAFKWSFLWVLTYLFKHVLVNRTVVVKEHSMNGVSGRQNISTQVFFFNAQFSFTRTGWHRPKLPGWTQFFRKWPRVWEIQGSSYCYLKGTRCQTVRTDTDAFLKKVNTSWIIFVRISLLSSPK